MHDMEHASPFTRGQHPDPKAPRKPDLYTGPDTSSQLLALQELEGIAAGQHPGALPTVTPGPSAQLPTPSLHRAPRSRRKTEEPLGVLGILRKHIRRLTDERDLQGESCDEHPTADERKGSYCGLGPNPAAVRGRHAAEQSLTVRGVFKRHGSKFASFSAIGAVVLVTGIAVQGFLVRLGAGAYGSFVIMAVFSIELSFVLNRRFTWRARNADLWRSCWKFNVQKFLTTIPNMALYALFVQLGLGWLLANLATTAIFTVVNYTAGDLWSFATKDARRRRKTPQSLEAFLLQPVSTPYHHPLPSVSVVIPCKGNEATIRATVDAMLSQDYPALAELILVGDVSDSTWSALKNVHDPRLVLLEQERTPGKRDPNVKRDKGLRRASGEILALVDSDIVMDRDWLSNAVSLLLNQGGGLVAGGMRSIHNTFWGRFVDRNTLVAKTPRLPRPYYVTISNFGKRGYKPPVTANVVFTRELYTACPLDVTWSYGYEDYEWFWRLTKQGHKIFFTGQLTGAHHHRRSFSKLRREYRQSASGCAHFIFRHRNSPLAIKRLWQALLIPAVAAGSLCGLGDAIASGHGRIALFSLCVVALVLVTREMVRARSVEAVAYLPFAVVLGTIYTAKLGSQVVSNLGVAAFPRTAPNKRRYLLGCALAVGLGIILRLWQLSSKPGWQVDEVTYEAIGQNLLRHGQLSLPTAYGEAWEPFLFHPPFYLLLLARWFALFGPGVYQARLLGVLVSFVSMVILTRLIWRLHGPQAALAVTVFIAADGWMLFIQRVSYIENLVLILVAGTFLVYDHALRRGSWPWFAAAGTMAGATTVFNHDGAYVLLAIAIAWAFTRKSHWLQAMALAIAASITGVYVAIMIWLFDQNGHDWYIGQTLIQLDRVLGADPSRGTLTTPTAFIYLAVHQYAVFAPSLLIALAGIIWLGTDLLRCVRRRNLAALGSDLILPAWLGAGVVVFGLSTLRYPQYFSLVLIPAYTYLWTRTVSVVRRRGIRPLLTLVLSVVVVAAGLGSFYLRVLSRNDNAYAAVRTYAITSIPRGALIVAESSIAYEIPQRFCSTDSQLQLSIACQRNASYLITWQTYLQSDNPFGSKAITQLLSHARPIARFEDFQGTVIVWKEMASVYQDSGSDPVVESGAGT
jgi:glycosyltransferase involved in cell wall biosynthesis/4-amino-4-deoxy-L-arabinose transferase-like glycosyltransferase/putative flippase GtrA